MKENSFLTIARIGLIALILVTSVPATALADSDKKADIKKLLKLSGIYDQLEYMKNDLLNSYSRALSFSYPKIPAPFWDEFNQLIGQKEMDDLIDKVIPVYDKHMDHETVLKLIPIFETPFWKEWKDKMPEISREAGLVGSDWAHELSQSKVLRGGIDALVKKYELEKLNPKAEEKK